MCLRKEALVFAKRLVPFIQKNKDTDSWVSTVVNKMLYKDCYVCQLDHILKG